MKFLITGGAGFIGSHITEKLLKQGHNVRVLDNFSSGKQENLSFTGELANRRTFELIKGDICNYATCLKATKAIDFVLHQAALRSVPKSLFNPKLYNKVNIDGTLNILKAALKNKVKRVVLASSSSIYGEAKKFPSKETDLPYLVSPYALTKLAGEYYCRIFSTNYGLETVSLRYFNVFGPRQSLENQYAVVVPKFITMMLKNKRPPVHGTGLQRRDFTYIDNVVNANICAAVSKGKFFGEVFNVGNGNDHSVLDLIKEFNLIMGKNIKPVFDAPRLGDVDRTFAYVNKTKKELCWKPEVNFKEGLRRTVEWFEKQF